MKKLLTFFLLLSFQTHASYIPSTRTLADGGSEIDFGLEYFKTTSFVDTNGKATSPPTGDSFQKYDLNFRGAYGLTRNLEIFTGIRYRVHQGQTEINDDSAKITTAGVESGMLGLKYSFKEDKGWRYAIEGSYRQAAYSNEVITDFDGTNAADLPYALGDDTRDIRAGLHVNYKTESNNYFNGALFYRDPSQYLSSEFFSTVDFAIVWDSFSLSAGIENVYSNNGDQYGDDPENKPIVYAGPTNLYNSVNRSWTAPYLKSHISLGKTWRLEGTYAQVITGNSTDLGHRINVNLVKRSETVDREFVVRDKNFKQYRVEGLVEKVSKNRKGCLIDKGLVDGVSKGMKIDFYFFDYTNGDKLIARGRVVKVQANRSLVKILKRYSKKRVEAGIVVRAGQLSLEAD